MNGQETSFDESTSAIVFTGDKLNAKIDEISKERIPNQLKELTYDLGRFITEDRLFL
jgi:hypothetical protein